MKNLDNHRTHYCPDSGFSLISENDAEFEVCACFRSETSSTPASSVAYAEAAQNSPVLAEQLWYRSISALARVCGTTKPVQTETAAEHQKEEVLVPVRKP